MHVICKKNPFYKIQSNDFADIAKSFIIGNTEADYDLFSIPIQVVPKPPNTVWSELIPMGKLFLHT